MSVLVNILTTYSGAGAKKAMRDMAVMQKQAGLAGDATAAGPVSYTHLQLPKSYSV